MQVEAFDCWANRSVYYLSKMYTSEIFSSLRITKCNSSIALLIISEMIICKNTHMDTLLQPVVSFAFFDYTDLMEMHILELSKLPPEEKNETSLLQWMRFLGGKTRKDFEEMAKKNSELEEAYDVLDKLSADEKKRLEYETRQRAIRDYNIGMLTAERRGIEAGRKIGREEGRTEGRAEGETLGVSRINQLIFELSKHGRTDDIVKAAADAEYQKKLLEEFDL